VARLRRERDEALEQLSEALEQQTATSNVLRVISSSPGELEPVFETMLKNAVRICGAKFGNLWLREGDSFYIGATHGAPPAYADYLRRERVVRADPKFGLGQVILTKQAYQVADISVEPTHKTRIATIELAGARTLIGVPMLKDDEVIGCIVIYRQEVRPFTDKQIELVKNFAAQAVIAIENTRLLNELRESLDRQTATSDILRVIAGTPEDSKRALDTIAETASRMFDVAHVNFRRLEGNVLRIVSSAGPTVVKIREVLPDLPLEPTDPVVRSFLDNRQIAVADRRVTLANEHGEIAQALRKLPGLPIGSQAFTPLSREGKAIGVMIVNRREVRPFQEHELDLMKGFADQAVIAIENARLLNELRQRTADLTQSLEQQTATAEVLQVISSSPGELEPVFQAMLENAVRICEASFGSLFRFNGKAFRFAAEVGTPPEYAEFQRQRGAFQPSPGGNLDHVMRTKQVYETVDAAAEPHLVASARLGGARSLIAVPMLKDEELVGSMVIYRTEVKPFTDKQIELLQNFASQAVIAIENTRLLNELRESLEQQTATSEVLKVISSSPGELEPVFEAILANATRICEAELGMLWRAEGDGFRAAALHGVPPELAGLRQREKVFHFDPEIPLGRVAQTKQLANRAGAELRFSSRHRHREHAPSKRIA
jgi:GAF domain-containing protein